MNEKTQEKKEVSQEKLVHRAKKHVKKVALKQVFSRRRYVYFLCILWIIYCVLIIFAKNIETQLSFPWVRIQASFPQGIDYEHISFVSWKDKISGIFVDSHSDTTIYYFHGNGWPLPIFFEEIQKLASLWYNVAAVEYPGFWWTPGIPYEENILKASNIFFHYLENSKHISEQKTIVWGLSIWAWAALNWSQWKSIDKLVLIAPLSSRYNMSKYFFWIPLQPLFFLWNSFENTKKIQSLFIPTLVIQWNNDKIVPLEQWKSVWKSSPSDHKFFIEMDWWWHNGILAYGGKLLDEKIIDFLQSRDIQQRYTYIDEYENYNYALKKNVFLLDMESDTSITKYINNQIHFANPQFVPDNLVLLVWDHVLATKWGMFLQKEALEYLEEMWADFFSAFNRKLHIVSGYRSFSYQENIKEQWCPDSLCAKAGYSEHQSWLAIDLFEASSEGSFLASQENQNFYAWLKENAHKYGFHNTYQKWVKIDGYAVEPWHWRYLWIELATYLHNNDITLAEFYSSTKRKNNGY